MRQNFLWKILCAVDVTVNELSNVFGNKIEKENFLYSVTDTEDPSTSVQIEISYNTETTEDSADNEDKKIEIKKGTISCEKNRKSRWKCIYLNLFKKHFIVYITKEEGSLGTEVKTQK